MFGSFSHWLILLRALLAPCVAAWQAEWVSLDSSSRITPRRSGLVSISSSQPPLIFGGYAEDTENEDVNDDAVPPKFRRYVVNDLWQWQQDGWYKIETRGKTPAPRLVGAAAVLRSTTHNKAYLMGGWNSDATQTDEDPMFLDTVHELDLDTWEWTLLPARIPDGAVSRHVVVALDDTILVHTHRCIDHVWLWNGVEFAKQVTTGPCPSARGLHAACRLPKGDHRVVFFGGAAQDQTMSNEVFILDTQTWSWQKLPESTVDQEWPSPRASPCLVAVDTEHVILYGGAEAKENVGLYPHGDVWLLHIDSATWTCLIQSNDTTAPPPRNGAALLPLDQYSGGTVLEFVLLGGWAPFVETWDDCHILRLKKTN